MKKKFLIVLLLFICLATTAQETRTHLVVWGKDGTQVAYALSEEPVITFSDSLMLIRTTQLEISYPLDQMAKLNYDTRDNMSVRDISTDEARFLFNEESLLFLNLTPNSHVGLYTVSGHAIFSRTIDSYGEYAFPISQLPYGVYVVQVNNLTYKISR